MSDAENIKLRPKKKKNLNETVQKNDLIET